MACSTKQALSFFKITHQSYREPPENDLEKPSPTLFWTLLSPFGSSLPLNIHHPPPPGGGNGYFLNLLGSYVTHVLHTARISNDERVPHNDTETLMIRLSSHLLGLYVTNALHTVRMSNNERVLYNDMETLKVRLFLFLLDSLRATVRKNRPKS